MSYAASMIAEYNYKISQLEIYAQQAANRNIDLLDSIETRKIKIKSSLLESNSMKNDYYKKFVTNEVRAYMAAKKISDYVRDSILPDIARMKGVLQDKLVYWQKAYLEELRRAAEASAAG